MVLLIILITENGFDKYNHSLQCQNYIIVPCTTCIKEIPVKYHEQKMKKENVLDSTKQETAKNKLFCLLLRIIMKHFANNYEALRAPHENFTTIVKRLRFTIVWQAVENI